MQRNYCFLLNSFVCKVYLITAWGCRLGIGLSVIDTAFLLQKLIPKRVRSHIILKRFFCLHHQGLSRIFICSTCRVGNQALFINYDSGIYFGKIDWYVSWRALIDQLGCRFLNECAPSYIRVVHGYWHYLLNSLQLRHGQAFCRELWLWRFVLILVDCRTDIFFIFVVVWIHKINSCYLILAITIISICNSIRILKQPSSLIFLRIHYDFCRLRTSYLARKIGNIAKDSSWRGWLSCI